MVSDRLWGHPAWSLTLDRLGDAGVKFIERTGEVGPPTPVQSGTGGDVVDGFDPESIVRVVGGSPGAQQVGAFESALRRARHPNR